VTKTATTPSWLLTREDYAPRLDRDAFVDRSIRAFLCLLGRLRSHGSPTKDSIAPVLKLASTFLLVLLSALSRSLFFVSIIGTYLLVLLCFQRGERIASVFKTGLAAGAFAFAVLLPSAFMGNAAGAIMITMKVAVSTGFVKLLSSTTDWTAITGSLRFFRVPDLFILVLDIAVKYIALLGEHSLHMLYALKLRSVGNNPDKTASLSGIAGTIFLKSKAMAEDMYAAMECRGFTGEYRVCRRISLSFIDCVFLLADVLVVAAFVATGA
jgi:cobalt/nickel transport system permease protein